VRPLILCVDDDSLVRDVTQAALERGGYRVLLAASGAEATSILKQAEENVSLAILDWTLRDIPTAEVITRLKTLQPGLKILVTSGHDRAAVVPWIAKQRIDGFLPKPYLPKQLVQRVEWMLRPRRPCAASGSAF
jgi:two-component system, cell cycle sensor histidine kinase and response regulator CckA